MLDRGATANVYAYGSDAVIKILRPGIPDQWAAIEAANTEAVHRAGFPAVEVLEEGRVDGRPATAFRRVTGPSMAEVMVTKPSQIEPLALLMAELQSEMHRSAAPDGLAKLKPSVRRKIATADRVSESDRAEASVMLEKMPSGESLCHGDLHPGNILMGKDGPVLIDWFDAVIGCPVADLVRSSLLLRVADNMTDEVAHFKGASAPTIRRVHDAYLSPALRLATALVQPALSELGRWEVVLAVSRLAEQVPPASLVAIWESRLCDRRHSPLLAMVDRAMTESTLA